jgi:signal recognition particle receptor subunit beta
MALIDSDAGEIVIRLVYDGPPEAGKTTSLRALAGSLAQNTYTPGEGPDGRTLWFDWMEYVGGRFEGCQIRCQIVSVPGQRSLHARRRRVIETADVVVFVGDSATPGTSMMLGYLLELREILADARPPVGVILQANKRDLPGAIPLDDLRQLLVEARWPIGVVESIAADGTGIRETFVYAVRLALDRVRELMIRRTLPPGSVGRGGAGELLDALRADGVRQTPLLVERAPGSVAASLLREVLSHENDAARTPAAVGEPAASGAVHRAPRPPDGTVPSGAIWPPVEGRAILCELAQVALAPRRLASGNWAAGLGCGWRVVSSRDGTFASLDQGRAALIQWARLHAGAAGAISPRRCIVLADDGNDGWRLWQIVRAERSLREAVDHALLDHPGESVVPRLRQLAQLLLDADDKLARMPLALPCHLDCIGALEGVAVYIGLMPETAAPTGPRPRGDPRALLRRELEPVAAASLRERSLDLDRVLARLPGMFPPAESLVPALTALVRH